MMFFMFAAILTITEQYYDQGCLDTYKYLITTTPESNMSFKTFEKEVPEEIMSHNFLHVFTNRVLIKKYFSKIVLIFLSKETKDKTLPIYEKYIFSYLKRKPDILTIIIKNQTPKVSSVITVDFPDHFTDNPILSMKIDERLNMFTFVKKDERLKELSFNLNSIPQITMSNWNTSSKNWAIFVVADFLSLLNIFQNLDNKENFELWKHIIKNNKVYINKIKFLSTKILSDKNLLNVFLETLTNQMNSVHFTLFVEIFNLTNFRFIKVEDRLTVSLFLLCLKKDLNELQKTQKSEQTQELEQIQKSENIFKSVIFFFNMLISEISVLKVLSLDK